MLPAMSIPLPMTVCVNNDCQTSGNVRKITPDGISSTLAAVDGESMRKGSPLMRPAMIYTTNAGSGNVWKITPDGASSILGTDDGSNRAMVSLIDAAGNVLYR